MPGRGGRAPQLPRKAEAWERAKHAANELALVRVILVQPFLDAHSHRRRPSEADGALLRTSFDFGAAIGGPPRRNGTPNPHAAEIKRLFGDQGGS